MVIDNKNKEYDDEFINKCRELFDDYSDVTDSIYL